MQTDFDSIIVEAAKQSVLLTHGLLCLISDPSAQEFIDPMPRLPDPECGFLLSRDLADRFDMAMNVNESIHDGAVVFEWSEEFEAYRHFRWSCRLLPPRHEQKAHSNRGSAYNSAFSASLTSGFDAVYFWAPNSVLLFKAGYVTELLRVPEDS